MNGSGQHRKLRPSGGYRTLRSFQTTTVIYDATVSFCERFIDKRSRLVDQMMQPTPPGCGILTPQWSPTRSSA